MVLDASVAAKWFLPAEGEPLSEQAFGLLERYAADQVQFAVPDLFWPEFGTILLKAARQGRIAVPSAAAAVAQMQSRQLSTVPSHSLLQDAFKIGNAFRRPVYDCIYVVLAVAQDTEFVTADERLANALAARLPVKWLGAI